MSYPTSIKEYFDPDGGINTILVKKNRPRPNVPPPPNPCMGATDSVDLKVSYRGSDWGEGISSAIEVNGEIWNIDHGENLLGRWGGVGFSVGGYNFVTTFEGRDGRATLSVEPHHNTDYVIVKIIPDSGDMEGNRLLGVIGGGQIKYDQFTTVAEFCLKPTLKPPISCIGASDRIMFGSQPMEQSVEQTFAPTAMVESPSGLTEMIYNVTMDGTNYGVIDFVQTPNPMFGRAGLSFEELPGGYGDCILKIQGGNIGDNHRFKLEPVESRGGNNIFNIFLEIGELDAPRPEFPTVEHNQETGVVEFCFAVMGKCDLAPDYLSFSHYDREADEEPGWGTVFPLVYNVTLNGVDFGEINFKNSEGEPYLTELGVYTIAYIPHNWGRAALGLAGGPVGVPAHIILDPVDAVRSNINYPDMNRTVEYDHATKRVEFCLTRDECSGASENLVINMQKLYDDGDALTDFYYAVEVEGITINANHSKNLLVWDGNTDFFGDGPNPLELSVGSDSYNSKVNLSVVSNDRGGIVKIKLTPPGNTPPSNFIGVDNISNPTVKVDENGVITACLIIYQPR